MTNVSNKPYSLLKGKTLNRKLKGEDGYVENDAIKVCDAAGLQGTIQSPKDPWLKALKKSFNQDRT